MSNRDECWRFGVLTPSGTVSLGVACNLSNIKLFWPAFGGARSCGMVSAAPGGGTCYVVLALFQHVTRYAHPVLTYRCTRANDDTRRKWSQSALHWHAVLTLPSDSAKTLVLLHEALWLRRRAHPWWARVLRTRMRLCWSIGTWLRFVPRVNEI
jgi:hypothetical protein